MSTIREQIQADCDTVADQMKVCQAAAHDITELQRRLGVTLDRMDTALRVIQSKSFINGSSKAMSSCELLKISLDQIRENRNRMDCGTFVVRSSRAMEAIWEVVP